MALLLWIIASLNNKAVETWKLPITPNSLIAVFTTVGKSAMVVPITSCISQLKWYHYRTPRELNHLQLFDDASRGPWGSVVLLWNFKTKAFLAWGFAIVTIAALGIEASAQQILDTSVRIVPLANTTAEIGIAESYDTKSFIDERDLRK